MSLRILCKKTLARVPILDGLFRRFIWSRLHFPEVEMRFLNGLGSNTFDISIDVGAAAGSYAWILNQVSRQVFAFEPGNVHYKCLKRMVFGTKITVIQAAVGNACERVKIYTAGFDTNALHSATLSTQNPVVEQNGIITDEVEQITIDSFVSERISRERTIDFLKIDVEGYEIEVLKGASKMISRHHPLIFCEIEARHNDNYEEVFGYLRTAGYECYIFRNGTFELFLNENIESIQKKADLDARLSGSYDLNSNNYINNFIFQHSLSCIKVKK